MTRAARIAGATFVFAFLALDLAEARRPDAAPEARREGGIRVAATGAITGRVVDESGVPIQGIYLWAAYTTSRTFAYESDDEFTHADGTFTMSGVADGTYFINVYWSAGPSNYVDSWYPDVWDFEFWTNTRSATPIQISGGNTVTIEMRVQSGTIFRFDLRDGSGQPIDINSQDPGCANAGFAYLGHMFSESGSNPLSFHGPGACGLFIDAGGGVYRSVAVPRGRKIWMRFWPEGFDFLPRFHDGKVAIADSTPLISSGSGETHVPMTLSERGPSISGSARLQSTTFATTPRRAAFLLDANGQMVRAAGFGPDGSATLGGIPDGDYKLWYFFRGRNAPAPAVTISKLWRNSSGFAGATLISVRGANVTGINVVLDTPADIVQVGGDWSGTYSESITCGGTTFTSLGNAIFNLTQSGSSVFGSGTLIDRKNILNSCAASGTSTLVGSISGNLSGSSFTGTFNGTLPLTGTFGAAGFSGKLTYPNGTSTLSLRSGSAARIDSFAASPSKIRLGEPATLSWRTTSAGSVAISGVPGQLPANGSVTVTPSATTTYTLTAGSSLTPPSSQVTVEVVALPLVSVATLPDALVQSPSESGATTTYTLLNSGGAASQISLSQDGSFFTQEPSSFTLAPGATQTVTIRSTQQPPGSYLGSASPTGAGVPPGLSVPIRLLVSAPPASGTATAQTPTRRVDVATAPNVPAEGTVSFTNSGTATLVGIITTDVPWLIVDTPLVTILPGQTVEVPFRIDRSKRPDGTSPLGSVSGTIRLTYQRGEGQGKVTPLAGGSVVVSTPVTVVDTAKPPTNTAVLQKLAPGEIARFVPRVSQVPVFGSTVATDLTVARSTGTSPVSDLRLFYTPSSQSGVTVATLGTLLPSQAIYLGNVVQSVFGKASEAGSMQLRSIDWDKITIQARLVNLGSARAGLGTEVPVFRSDRSAGAGERLYFTGLRRDETTQASVYLQETSGSPASVSTEFLDAAGNVLATRAAETILPFSLLELQNVIPAGTVTVVVNHSETSGGQVVGFAAMSDTTTGDSWNVTDWARYFGYKNSDAVRVPLVESSVRRRRPARRSGSTETSAAARTELTLFNPGASTTSATLLFTGASGATFTKSVSIDGRKTLVMADVASQIGATGRGSLLVTPTAGSIVVTSGLVNASFSATVPALASSSGLKLGGSISFANLEDSTAATVSANTAGTLRTSFGILESAGAMVKVRATLTYADGTTPVASTLTRDFTVGPRQQVNFDGLAAAIIGPARETAVGELRQVRVFFQIVEGEGSATIFVRSTDNSSGDSIVRVE